MSFESIVEKVENVIAKLGIEPKEARTTNKGQWNISKDKKTEIMMDVWDENGFHFFQILSDVCPVSQRQRPTSRVRWPAIVTRPRFVRFSW